jgi:hypothetical protein
MKMIRVADLRAHLGACLGKMPIGAALVTSRQRRTPVAEIVPFRQKAPALVVRPASRPPAALSQIKGVRPRSGDIDVVAILRASRDQR